MVKSTTEKLHSRKLAKVIVSQKDFEQCSFVHAKLFEKVQERDLDLTEISADGNAPDPSIATLVTVDGHPSQVTMVIKTMLFSLLIIMDESAGL